MTQTSAFPKSWRARVSAVWLLVVLFTIPLVGYIHRLIINILIDPISTEFAISDTQASLLQGPPFAIVYGLMVIPMGLLSDRGSRVTLLSIGALLWSVGTLMCGIAPTFTMLFLARMLVGLGEASLVPAVVSLIGDSFADNRRGLAMGIFFMGVNAGFSSAYAVGGITLEMAEAGVFQSISFLAELSPWRQVFLVLSVPGFLLPIFLLTVKEPKRHNVILSEGIWRPLRQLLSSKPLATILILLMLQASILAVADNGLYAWLPRLLSRLYHLEPTEIGLALGAIVAVAGAVGGPLGGKFSDLCIKRYGTSGPLLVILVAVCAATFAAPLFAMGSKWIVYGATAIWVTALVAASTSTFTFVSVAAPGRVRGVAASLLTSIIALVGLGAGPTTIAIALEGFSFTHDRVDVAILVSVLPLCCISLALGVLIWKKTRGSPTFLATESERPAE